MSDGKVASLNSLSTVGQYPPGPSVPQTKVTGIRFSGCIFYGGATQIEMYVGLGCGMDSIWFVDGCQSEGQDNSTAVCFSLTANGGYSYITNIHIDHMYMSGTGFSVAVKGTVASTGSISNIWITDNFIWNAGTGNGAILFDGSGGSCREITITGNHIAIQTANSNAMIFANCTNMTVNNNSLTGTLTAASMMYFVSGNDRCMAIGNNCGGHAPQCVAGTPTNSTTSPNQI